MNGAAPSPLLTLPELTLDDPLTWILVGFVVYWIGLYAIDRRGLLPEFVKAGGPLLTIHTKRGREFLDRLSRPKRLWRAGANAGIGVALVVMVGTFVGFLSAAIAVTQTPQQPTVINEPRNVLVIPGVNDFLPLSAAPGIVFGLAVGLIVHEGAHGLLCRVEDIDIESMGIILIGFLPLGAFVEPEEESAKSADRGAQTRMFAAGITANLLVTLLAFGLLFGPVAGSIAVAPGAAIGATLADSPADDAGIGWGDRIVAVDDEAIETNEDFERALQESDRREATVELADGETRTVERVVVVAADPGDDSAELHAGDRILAVDGQAVYTHDDFQDAVGDAERVTVELDRDGETLERELPLGALATVTDGGPLADAGAPVDARFVITAFEGERTASYADLREALSATEEGDQVTVAGYLEGDRVTYDVTLGEYVPSTGGGTLGFTGKVGTTGLSFTDAGFQLYPANEYLVALGGGDREASGWGPVMDSFFGKVVFAIFLPLVGLLDVLPFSFAGFAGGVEHYYQVTGPLGIIGDGAVFAIANLLFWTGWLNLNLAAFNCIPAFPLDGGHILRSSTEAVLSRLPFQTKRGHIRVVTTLVGVTMLVSILLLFFGPRLLN